MGQAEEELLRTRLAPGVTPETPCIRVHSVLPNSVQTLSLVPFEMGDDGVPLLPTQAFAGTAFLKTVEGEWINVAFVHRIEGLPDAPPRSGD